MVKSLYALENNNNPNPILWEEQNNIAFKHLKESLINPLAPRHPYSHISFVYVKRKGMPLGYSTKHGDHYQHAGYFSKKLDPVARGETPLS